MQHKSHFVPVISPNIKLSGIWSLTFLQPQVHLTGMTFIFALVLKNLDGLGFLHSLKRLSPPHLLLRVLFRVALRDTHSPAFPDPSPQQSRNPVNALAQPWTRAQLLIFGSVPCWHGLSFMPSQLQPAFAWQAQNVDGGHSWLSALVHIVIYPRW